MACDRDPIDELAEEFVELWRRGEYPSVASWAHAHPAHADTIQRLFPTLIAIECLKSPLLPQSPACVCHGDNLPERIGDCRIVREIGRGGMGVVYEAVQEPPGRRVAVKVLPTWIAPNKRHLQRFLRESRNTAKLHHPHIVSVYGAGNEKGTPYFVMQYIPGVGLDEVLEAMRDRRNFGDDADPAPSSTDQPFPSNRASSDLLEVIVNRWWCDSIQGESHRGGMSWRSAARVAIQVADALHYAHGKKIIHRDVKPGNLLIDNTGAPWVTDFGLAKSLSASGSCSGGDIVGTMRYMAPEQFRGECDARCDVYSLGITLYEMLTLRPAFAASDVIDLVRAVTNSTPCLPSLVQPDIPPELEAIVMKAAARDPQRRHSSAMVLANELRHVFRKCKY